MEFVRTMTLGNRIVFPPSFRCRPHIVRALFFFCGPFSQPLDWLQWTNINRIATTAPNSKVLICTTFLAYRTDCELVSSAVHVYRFIPKSRMRTAYPGTLEH